MRGQTEKTTFSCKDDYMYIGVGSRNLYIDKAHTALDIFCFAAFFKDNFIFSVSLANPYFILYYTFTFLAPFIFCPLDMFLWFNHEPS